MMQKQRRPLQGRLLMYEKRKEVGLGPSAMVYGR